MSTLGLMQSKLTLQETRSVHDLMNRQKLNLLYFILSVKYQNQISYKMAGFLDILNYTRHKGELGTAKMPNSHV